MNGLRAPDVPAYVCYGIVLILGLVVAFVSVNKLLAEKRDRWSYPATWLLVTAYTILPVTLFWFLDYQGAIADTSLFWAIVIAVGYQQVLSGAVEGIRLPGQTSAIWGVFKAWADRVAMRIDRLNQARNARQTERVLASIAASKERTDQLSTLVFDQPNLVPTLEAELARIETAAAKSSDTARRRRVVKRLWDELRRAEPDNYVELLRSSRLLDPTTYWWTFRNGRSIAMTTGVIIVIAVTGSVVYLQVWKSRNDDLRLSYSEWRMTRPSLTAADEVRTCKELLIALRKEIDTGVAQALVDPLTYRDLPVETAQRILDFLLFSHGERVTDRIHVPLVHALKTPNPDIRARLQHMLVELQDAEFPNKPLTGEFKSLADWKPSKDDSAGQIDGRIRAWLKWLAAPAPTKVETTLMCGDVVTLQNVLFDSGKATLRPAAADILKQVADTLAQHPELELLVCGHTDDVGTDGYNLDLSQRRAAAVVADLVGRGIDGSRLTALGKGKSRPLLRDTTPSARESNRRVEISRIDRTVPANAQ